MGKICWINGQPYSVGLPTGGKDGMDCNSEWDRMIDFLGEDSDSIFHWSLKYSWCQDEFNTLRRVVRGYGSARWWNNHYFTHSYPSIGFRPVLTPLNTNTMEPDPSLLEGISDGQKIALASLYMDGKPVNLSKANVSQYAQWSEIILSDRNKNKKYWLYVIKQEGLLWADRNILTNISWKDLQEQGYTD